MFLVGTKRQEINRIDQKKKRLIIQQGRDGGGKLQLELVKLQIVSGIAVQDPVQLIDGKTSIAVWICLWTVMTLHSWRFGV